MLAGPQIVLGPSRVEGRVIDLKSGLPLQGVRITLVGVETQAEITDKAGHFKFLGLVPGDYRLLAEKRDFILLGHAQLPIPREPQLQLRLARGESPKDIVIHMAQPSAITGVVQDSNGEPVPSRGVTLSRYAYNNDGIRYLANVLNGQTNDRGEFRLFGLPPGGYYVSVGGALGDRYVSRRTYYPGTTAEDRADIVHVGPGDEVRLNTLLLQRAKAVRLRLGLVLPPPARPALLSIQVGDFFFSSLNVDGRTEVSIPLTAGHYEYSVANYGFSAGVDQTVHYGRVNLDVGTTDIDLDVPMARAFRLSNSMVVEDAQGTRRLNIRNGDGSVVCRLKSIPPDILGFAFPCAGPTIPPGFYRVEVTNLPANMYVLSATVAGTDLLNEGLRVTADTQLEVRLGSPGTSVQGTVRNAKGTVGLADAIVALVPAPPLRGVALWYRSSVSDILGHFELQGVAPGTYHLFAWENIEGEAFRNAQFMKKYDARGTLLRIGKDARILVDVTPLQP